MFNCESITAFMRNKNIKESIGSNEIEKPKKKTNTETKIRQMIFMPDKLKVTLSQASTKNNYF